MRAAATVHRPRPSPWLFVPLALGLLLAIAAFAMSLRAQQRMDECFAAVTYAAQDRSDVADWAVLEFCK